MKARIAAAILAGGKGERLGGSVKANVLVGGIRLLERVSVALHDADVTLVSLGGFRAAELAILPGQIAVPDLLSDYRGPVAGVAAAADWCLRQPIPPDLLVTAAVDTPFLPNNYIALMLSALPDGAPGVIAAWNGQDYPTNALWRVTALAGLATGMLAATAPRSLRRLGAGLGAISLDWPDTGRGDPFANVNTPDDLAAMQTRAARQT